MDQNQNIHKGAGASSYSSIANPAKPASMRTTEVHRGPPAMHPKGASAGPQFGVHLHTKRNRKEHYGVIESHPGIIESTNIEPLKHELM